MLTPTDIHYLAGLLTLSSSPDDVDIVLGDMVPDEATGTRRDVDITITCKAPDGSIRAFKGMEVKGHSRPLDVVTVEQLCIKLKDMPSISHRAIISASGYTKPAIKKARYHGVELWHLKPWDDPSTGFGHVKFPADFPFNQIIYKWITLDHVQFNPARELSHEVRMAVSQNPRVCDQHGNDLPNCANLQTLGGSLSKNALNAATMNGDWDQIGPGEIKRVEITVAITDNPCIDLPGNRIILEEAIITGSVICERTTLPSEFKILIEEGADLPYAGCAIAEFTMGHLIGIAVNRNDRKIKAIHVSVSDRLKDKIYRQELQRNLKVVERRIIPPDALPVPHPSKTRA